MMCLGRCMVVIAILDEHTAHNQARTHQFGIPVIIIIGYVLTIFNRISGKIGSPTPLFIQLPAYVVCLRACQ